MLLVSGILALQIHGQFSQKVFSKVSTEQKFRPKGIHELRVALCGMHCSNSSDGFIRCVKDKTTRSGDLSHALQSAPEQPETLPPRYCRRTQST